MPSRHSSAESDAEPLISKLRGDDPELASYLPPCVSLAASFGSSARLLALVGRNDKEARVAATSSPVVADAWGGNTLIPTGMDICLSLRSALLPATVGESVDNRLGPSLPRLGQAISAMTVALSRSRRRDDRNSRATCGSRSASSTWAGCTKSPTPLGSGGGRRGSLSVNPGKAASPPSSL